MFSFSIDQVNGMITTSIKGVQHSPKTSMFFPKNASLEIDGDIFSINGVKYTPTIENTVVGRKIVINF